MMYETMCLRFLPLLLLACVAVSSALAAPQYPFPATRRADDPSWWRSGASLALENPDLGRLSFGWDADYLYLHLADAAEAGTLSLQVPAGERRVTWTGTAVRVGIPNGRDIAAPVTVATNGSRAMDISLPWADLGLKPGEAGRAIPLCIGYGATTWPTKWLPNAPIPVRALEYGALYLNDTAPLEICAPTLTRPFEYRFDPSHGTAHLTISPEPISGLCLPVEIVERGIAPDTVLRTQRTAGGAARFELPSPDAKAVSISVRVPMYSDALPAFEYRTLRADVPLGGYAGTPGWTEPSDWEGYWARARADLAKTPMNARISEVPERASATGRLYRVELDSLDNVTIVCWYFVPRDVDVLGGGGGATKYPAVQITPGYGAEEPPIDRTANGYITLSVNPRGHGPSGAFWPLPGDHLNWNITNPEKYYYRGAYMDCVRAMQFLMGRPEVNAARVGVEGSSQGGALALATAALDQRVAACSANVPFLCDIPSGSILTTRGGMGGLRARFEADTPEATAMRKSLGYIDASIMAGRVHCPTLIAVGEMDRTCPPQGGAAAYNRIPKNVEKRFLSVPLRDHEVMPEWRAASEEWFGKYLKG